MCHGCGLGMAGITAAGWGKHRPLLNHRRGKLSRPAGFRASARRARGRDWGPRGLAGLGSRLSPTSAPRESGPFKSRRSNSTADPTPRAFVSARSPGERIHAELLLLRWNSIAEALEDVLFMLAPDAAVADVHVPREAAGDGICTYRVKQRKRRKELAKFRQDAGPGGYGCWRIGIEARRGTTAVGAPGGADGANADQAECGNKQGTAHDQQDGRQARLCRPQCTGRGIPDRRSSRPHCRPPGAQGRGRGRGAPAAAGVAAAGAQGRGAERLERAGRLGGESALYEAGAGVAADPGRVEIASVVGTEASVLVKRGSAAWVPVGAAKAVAEPERGFRPRALPGLIFVTSYTPLSLGAVGDMRPQDLRIRAAA